MATHPELRAHREWLGYAQPVGLVVSPPALHAAQAVVERNPGALHARFLAWVDEVKVDGRDEPALAVLDLPGLLRDVFNWRATDLAGAPGGPALGDDLAVALPEYDDLLRPTYAVVDPEPGDGAPRWSMLIEVVKPGTDLDALPDPAPGFAVSPELRFERLLRDTRVPQGLLCNGLELRLVYAPHGETAGYLPFPVAAMSEVAGRPLLAGLHLLLEADRVFGLEKSRRLPAILAQSRKYQTLVGVALAEQVLEALFELLRGFQAADDQRHGDLLREVLDAEPNHVYGGLLAVLLRLVFLLYAEERGMMPRSEVFAKHYAVMGLFERLKNDRDERSAGVAKLRELHASMDRSVLHAYGWDDVATGCDFFLEWEDEEDDEPGAKKKKAKKKPWRYRWPDEVHDEVLARLLELNRERANEEKREGKGARTR